MYKGPFSPVQRLIPGITLAEYQARTALSIATESKHLILFETGLGKTLSTIAGLLMRINNQTTKKILWLSPLDIMSQTIGAFQKHTKLRCILVTGKSKGIKKVDISANTVTFVNFEAFDETSILEWLSTNAGEYDTIVIDEGHAIANPFSSNRNGFIFFLATRVENLYILTATPTISRIDQFAVLLCLMKGSLNELISYRNQIHNGYWLPEHHSDLISYKKRDQVIDMEVISFEEIVVRGRSHGTAMFKDTRGLLAKKPYEELSNIIHDNNLKHIIIYANITDHHEPLKKFIEEKFEMRVGIMSGDPKINKQALQEEFNAGHLDVLIYSVTSGRDLPAESVIFFEWDVYAAQSLGRAIRSEVIDKNFKVYFLLNTVYEQDMFINTVVKTGILSQTVLQKNIFKNLI